MGPTATGKTALACALADRFPVQLISVDSALVYRGLDIGSAKPDAQTLLRHPHRLIDVRDPVQAYSAADFRRDALDAMAQISAAGCIPLLVGGTGLYFRALERGLSALPEADPELRAALADAGARLGWESLHRQLADADPVAARRIGAGDAQRIQRALEVIALTGQTLTGQQLGRAARIPWRILKLALVPADRGALHDRIALRVDGMLAAGFVAEVGVLRALPGIHEAMPAARAVGYRQAWQHLAGEFDALQLRDRMIFATRQLAKRQTTWLRSDVDARWVDPGQPDCAASVTDAVQRFLPA